MAITEDASTPATISTGTGTGNLTTGSFSPPAESLLVALVAGGWNSAGSNRTTASVSDSAGGTWTSKVTATGVTTNENGVTQIFERYLNTAPGSITVTASFTNLSGGRMLAVRVLNGAASDQSAAATASFVNPTFNTTGTFSITTTVAGSQVYGISDDPHTAATWTANAATTALSSGVVQNSTDGVTYAAWKATNVTGTPGATTLGGTWGASTNSNQCAVEVLAGALTGAVTLAADSALSLTPTGTFSVATTMAAAATLSAAPLTPPLPQFPNAPRTTFVELFLNGGWVDVTSDVYARDGIQITRGARDETSTAEPSRCQLTLNNRTGNYSPRNPSGLYYGSVGRNTPLRISVGKDRDTFNRVLFTGWGSTDYGSTWSTFGSGGTLAATDYAVSPGSATHSVPVAGGYRVTYLGGQLYGDVDVAVTVQLSLPSVTGNSVAPANLLLRGVDSINNLYVWVFASEVDQQYYCDLYTVVNNVYTSLVGNTASGVTYYPNQPVRIRAQTEGPVIRMKIWDANGSEPFDWLIVGGSGTTTMGWVGVESFISVSNTNTKPIVFTYTDWVIRVPRYAGEVSYWPQRWDTSGNDVHVPIEGSGIKRRLGQGTDPTDSAMFTAVTTATNVPLVYWPCEDGPDSTQISAVVGRNPMYLTGTTKFADFTGFACSQPLPTLSAGRWQGRVPPYTSVLGAVSVQYLLHVSSSEPPDNWPISQVFCAGSAPQWELKYRTGGFLQVNVWSPGGILYDSGQLGFVGVAENLIDSQWLLLMTIFQNGSDASMNLYALRVGSTTATFSQHTATNKTVGQGVSVVIDPYQKMKGASVGHIAVTDASPSIYAFSPGLNAYSGSLDIGGETTGNRIKKLALASNTPLDWWGSLNTTQMAGPQLPLPLLTLLEEAAAADQSILHESRGRPALMLRPRTTMYNQSAALTLNYTAGQVAPPLEPVDDDQLTRNDVIAKRTGGGQFEVFLSSGRLSVSNPWVGGVGRYTDQPSVTVAFDSQLPDIAGWRLLLGTVDEPRYPTIRVNLANPNVVAAGLDNAAMTTNVGDRIVITNPKTGQTPDPVAQIVRGYTETLNAFAHTISFVCAPASPYDVLRANVAGTMTVSTDGSTLASAVGTLDTTLSVATVAGGVRWITGAVNFDIVIDGERMTVTNIAGTSSPQTFTVTRAVNGVVKTHSSGAVVTLFRRAIVGL